MAITCFGLCVDILDSYKEDVYPFLVSVICEPVLDVQFFAVKCVMALYRVSMFLTVQEKSDVVQHFLRILQEVQREDIRWIYTI